MEVAQMAMAHVQVSRRCGCVDPETGRQRGTQCSRLSVDDEHGSWYFAVQLRSLDGQRQRIRQGGYADREEAETAGKALVSADRDGEGAGCTLELAGRWPGATRREHAGAAFAR
ncbi:hypothetical protein ACFLIM_44895 [Nonomuraea sp. M3C6]|uniref:DUF1508 domain-containing protein n=1 Tax=Nonomuraea marmarensis TaxID=3351344 RepID=A0ABW7ASD0_9ACTN